MARKRPNRRVAGFTLIEALAALAITGLALSAVFTIGMRGVSQSFRFGQRAVMAADEQVSVQAVRDLLDAMVLPPLAVTSQAAETESETADQNGMGDEFDGAADSVAGYVIAARDNPCVPVGGEGRITLTFSPVTAGTAQHTLVQCQLNTEDPVTVATLNWPDAVFSFSEDGLTWTDSWQVVRGQNVDAAATPDAEQRRVYIRIASADGAHQIVALTQSGRPIAQTATALQ